MLSLGACASIPTSTISYYHAETSIEARVSAIVSCPEGDGISVSFVSAIEPTNRADLASSGFFTTGSTASFASDRKVGFDFYGDGRLKGLNSSSVGQGGAFIKAALEILPIPSFVKKSDETDPCDHIAATSPKSRTVTVKLEGRTTPSRPVAGSTTPPTPAVNVVTLEPVPTSAQDYQALSAVLGAITLSIGNVVELEPPVRAGALNDEQADSRQEYLTCVRGDACLSLRHPAIADAVVGRNDETILLSRILVAQLGRTYGVRVPRAAPFGNSNFQMEVDEFGALTKIQYGATDGTTAAIGSAGNLRDALTQTDAERLSALKLESDLIAQEQRRAVCRADPENCK